MGWNIKQIMYHTPDAGETQEVSQTQGVKASDPRGLGRDDRAEKGSKIQAKCAQSRPR